MDSEGEPSSREFLPPGESRATFVVRIDVARQGSGSMSLRGQVEHIQSGSSAYFSTLQQLTRLLRQWALEEEGWQASQ